MNTAQKIAKESIISFSGIFYGSINRYLYSALLARWVGPEYLGIYSMANAIMLISEVLSKMGMETGVMRFVSRLDPDKDNDKISEIIASAIKMCAFFSLFFMIILISCSSYIVSNILSEQSLMVSVLIVFAISIPFNASTLVAAAATQGYKKLKYKSIVTQFINPTILLVSMIICYWFFSPESALMFPMLITGIVGCIAMFQPLKYLSGIRPQQIIKTKFNYDLLNFSYPFMFVIILQTFMHWMDILMLGYFTNASTVGLYHPAARTAGLLQALLISFISIYAPMISQFHSEKNILKMNQTYKMVSRWLLIFSIPISIMFILFPENILSLFGKEYISSANVLIILTISTLLQAIFGAASPTLGMSGFTRLVLINTCVAFILNLGLNYTLIPLYGINGAAYATLITLTIVGFIRATQVRIFLKMNLFSIKMLKPLAAGVATYFFTINLKHVLENYSFFAELMIALPCSMLIYGILIWLMRLDEEDKSFISSFGIIKKGLKRNK
ncbi:MAG: flippase [Candidatus Neomarinimicrobiota bacterium]|nr:flippase [Candidatus Neomarinimicrobiota bacterium]